MPAPERSPAPRRSGPRGWWPHSPWLLVPGAIVLGFVLFLLVWLLQREPGAEPEAPAALPHAGQRDAGRASLPAPDLSAAADLASPGGDGPADYIVMPEAPEDAVQAPPAAVADAQASALPGPASAAVAGPERAAVPVRSPPPSYPRSALRRGEAGEVLVRVRVGANGRPEHVEVARSSSHSSLDQAAVNAVRRWRFEPATRQGQPVAQTIQVPVQFSAGE